MQDSYYDSSVGFLQESLEMIGENLAYGFFTINDFIKEYDPFPLTVFFAEAAGGVRTSISGGTDSANQRVGYTRDQGDLGQDHAHNNHGGDSDDRGAARIMKSQFERHSGGLRVTITIRGVTYDFDSFGDVGSSFSNNDYKRGAYSTDPGEDKAHNNHGGNSDDRDVERTTKLYRDYITVSDHLGINSFAYDKNNVQYDILSSKAYVEKAWEEFNAQFKNTGNTQSAGKEYLTANQILVFANAAYYKDDGLGKRLQEGNEQDSKVFKTYEDKRFASKASVITTKNGVASFNIAGTADPTEEGLENFIRDSLNNVLIGTNNLQGILKDRIDWYISSIEKYNKESGNKQPLIINGHSSGGFEGIIISVLRPDLVSQVNMVDSPGAYDIVLKLVNGDKVKASEIYKKVEIYNGNRNIVNSKGSHPPGKMVHHIKSDEHKINTIIEKYGDYGYTKILGRCYSDSLCSYKDGEYKVERLRDGVTKKEIADYFGVSVKNVEFLDNKSLSEDEHKEFKEKISSKFRINNKPEGEKSLKESRDKTISVYTNCCKNFHHNYRSIPGFRFTAWENEYFIVREVGVKKVIVYPNNNPSVFPHAQRFVYNDYTQTFIKDFSIEKLTNILKSAIASPRVDYIKIVGNDGYEVQINHKGKVYVVGDSETMQPSIDEGGWQLQVGDMIKYAFDNIDRYTANRNLGGVNEGIDRLNQAQNNLKEAYDFLDKKYNQYGFRSNENRVWNSLVPGLNIFIKTLEVEKGYKELQNSLAALKHNLIEQTKINLKDASNRIFNLNGDFKVGDKKLTIFVPGEINLSDELSKRVKDVIAVTKHPGTFRVIDGAGDVSWLAKSGVAEELLSFDLPEEMPMTIEEMSSIKKYLKITTLYKDEL